jgi:hypothetical protein
MKWGVRRSEKQLSRVRGSEGESKKKAKDFSDDDLKTKVNRLNLEKQYTDLSKEGAKSSKMEKTKKALDAISSLVNQAKSLNQQTAKSTSQKLDLKKMTDQQLRDRINRTNLERQYNDLFGSEARTVSKGQRYASNVLEVAGTTLAVGSSVLGIALAIKELRG